MIQAQSLYEYNAVVVNTESYYMVVYRIVAITVPHTIKSLNRPIIHILDVKFAEVYIMNDTYDAHTITGIDYLSVTIGHGMNAS